MKKYLLNFSRYFVGTLFIFSGLIKANDPWGFGIKLEEYYEVFYLDKYLGSTATLQAVFICGFEIICGILLLLGIKAIQNAWAMLLMIIFFTFLTFVSAFFEVVTSCGCFGDAIPLTSWQSFSKDVVLLIFIVIIFRGRKEIQSVFISPQLQKLAIVLSVFFGMGIGIYTYQFLPFVDFMPYKIGANIPALMQIPDDAPRDEYEVLYHLKHKTTGEEKHISDKKYIETGIYNDANWEITGEPQKKLIKKGYQPPITDLLITDATQNNYTSEIIENPFYNLVIVSYDLKTAHLSKMKELNNWAIRFAEDYNARVICLTANSVQDAEKYSEEHQLKFEFFFADAVPLKSMVRANPGILLMKNGTIINKWSFVALPSYDDIKKDYLDAK